MATNDETKVIEDGLELTPQTNEEKKDSKRDNSSWRKVAIGTTSGILLGVGASYAVDAFAANDTNSAESKAQEDIKVAKVSDSQSFADAFASARAQVGAGGVFHWHGGVYGTYTESEWNALSDEGKADFAKAAQPEIRANAIANERMADHEAAHTHDVHEASYTAHQHSAKATATNEESDAHSETSTAQREQDTDDSDVHIVGYGQVQGHQAVALDLNGNGDADVAIIDWNDNGRLDDPDVIIDRNGNYANMGMLAQGSGPGHHETEDNSGFAADTDAYTQDPNLPNAGYDDSTGTDVPDMDVSGDADSGSQDDGGYVTI